MTFAEIKGQVMFQTNNDADDLGDFTPYLGRYINEAYDRIAMTWDNQHVPSTDYPALSLDTDVPNLPEWLHIYIANYATWLIYRNGNPQKQSRGSAFYSAFAEVLARVADAGGKDGLDENGKPKKYRNFSNIPV